MARHQERETVEVWEQRLDPWTGEWRDVPIGSRPMTDEEAEARRESEIREAWLRRLCRAQEELE